MGDSEKQTLIESPHFPISTVNDASAKEKGPGRPPYWEMVFWWTRKPLIGARAVIAGSLLSGDIDPAKLEHFKHRLHLTENGAHRKNPAVPPEWRKIFGQVRLLDPFAGFGSIPLEAVRLGVGEVVAVELLPTAYVFLKAILEYPKWAAEQGLGKKLIEDVERWGKWVTERLKEDPEIKELYDEDVAVYIGTWEVRCPHCSKWTPLVGNWWLARVKSGASKESEEEEGEKSGSFERLAWMEPVKTGDRIAVKIVDLNRELGRETLEAKMNRSRNTIEVNGRKYSLPQKNVNARGEAATCLHCNNQILKGLKEWYVKEAVQDWNKKLEQYLSGQIDVKTLLDTTKARPIILAKVRIVNSDLEFQPASQGDNDKLWKALERLRQMWGDPDIPTEPIPPYGNIGGGLRFPVAIVSKWYEFFNPRQLLTLVKLVKLIREAGKKVEEEKLGEGWSKEDSLRYAEAVTIYLTIALCRHIYDNSIVTSWNPATGFGSTLALLRSSHSLAYRGIAMVWNWTEYPIIDLTVGYARDLKHVINGLSYLVSTISDSSSRVRVLLDDAAVLSKLNNEKFDVIVTDPPYRDDVAYAELSDFYYIWLKRALSDVVDIGGLTARQPRFLKEAFFKNGAEIETQWRYFADKEVSESEGRSRFFGGNIGSLDHFKALLTKSFQTMVSRLVDGGILVTYYAHTSPEAWEALLEAGWRGAGLRVTTAHALATESKQRVTARGKAGLDISIVAVWRKGVGGQALASEVYSEAVERCTSQASALLSRGFGGVDLLVGVLGHVLSTFTSYEKIVGVKETEKLVKDYVYPATAEAISRALGSPELAGRLSSASLFYLLGKVLIARRPRQTRRTLDRSTAAILAIATRNEVRKLGDLGLVKQEKEKFHLLEPAWGQRDPVKAVRSVLEEKEVDLRNPVVRTAVDLLHLLEYYAITLPKSEFIKNADELRAKYPSLYDEAQILARLLEGVLPPSDPEHDLISSVVGALGISQVGLGRWLGGD